MHRHSKLAIGGTILAFALALPLGWALAAHAAGQPGVGHGGSVNTVSLNTVVLNLVAGTTATFRASNGTIVCSASAIGASIGTDPIGPGTYGGTVPSWTADRCTSTIPGIPAVNGLTIGDLPYKVVIGPTLAFTLTPINTAKLRFAFDLVTEHGPVTAIYQAGTVKGTVSGAHTFDFTDQQLQISGPDVGPTTLSFSASYGPGFQGQLGTA